MDRRVMRARVLIRPKAGILDPQGQAVERALPALGFGGVRDVHVGRLIELDVEDPAQLPEMCERLLANPLIEDYEILATGDAPGSHPSLDNPRPLPSVDIPDSGASTGERASTRGGASAVGPRCERT
jgi:phosphoribosylformylglycinamidine synthase subunit PurS